MQFRGMNFRQILYKYMKNWGQNIGFLASFVFSEAKVPQGNLADFANSSNCVTGMLLNALANHLLLPITFLRVKVPLKAQNSNSA